jgi:hypothetical protein
MVALELLSICSLVVVVQVVTTMVAAAVQVVCLQVLSM